MFIFYDVIIDAEDESDEIVLVVNTLSQSIYLFVSYFVKFL